MKLKKRGQTWETLVPWVIAVGIFVLLIILASILSGKGTSAIDYLKTLIRFGR